jgi:hypothetical protein
LIEAKEIFEQIEQDSQTIGQVITETNYIINELKDYRDLYAKSLERCRYCGGTLHIVYHKNNQECSLQCENCKTKDKE